MARAQSTTTQHMENQKNLNSHEKIQPTDAKQILDLDIWQKL